MGATAETFASFANNAMNECARYSARKWKRSLGVGLALYLTFTFKTMQTTTALYNIIFV